MLPDRRDSVDSQEIWAEQAIQGQPEPVEQWVLQVTRDRWVSKVLQVLRDLMATREARELPECLVSEVPTADLAILAVRVSLECRDLPEVLVSLVRKASKDLLAWMAREDTPAVLVRLDHPAPWDKLATKVAPAQLVYQVLLV